MLGWLQQLYTFISLFPFVAFFITRFASYWITRDKKKSTHLSMDITTLFLIGSVWSMSRNVLQSGMLIWIILLLFLIAAGLLGNLQNRLRGKIDLWKIGKTMSRFGFIVLTACYVILLCLGIGKYMLL